MADLMVNTTVDSKAVVTAVPLVDMKETRSADSMECEKAES